MSNRKAEDTYYIACHTCQREVNFISKDPIKEPSFYERLICGDCNSRNPLVEFLSEAQDRWQQEIAEQAKRDEEMDKLMEDEEQEAIRRAARWDPYTNYYKKPDDSLYDGTYPESSTLTLWRKLADDNYNWDSEESEWTSDNGDYGKHE
ncbi:MAG: hypothetical protein CMA31_02190 [Euryarchaeota archaeon]|nr:hypothetical protein [Euryarchaeota archaeon]|tara:strand:- start:1757 stop:2203 length:447 start_codon:yes stop_codon:yes gene_type:complete